MRDRFAFAWVWPFVFAAVVCCVASVCGQEPVNLEIVGPVRFQRDDFGSLSAKGPAGFTYRWEFTPPTVKRRSDKFGDTVLFVGPPGQYVVRLWGVGPSGDESRPWALYDVERSISIVEGDNPPPLPGPDRPVIPDGKYGVAKIAFDMLAGSTLDRSTGVTIASNASLVAGDVAKYANGNAVIQAFKTANARAIENLPNAAAWRSLLNQMAEAVGKKLPDTAGPAEVAALISEVGVGVRAWVEWAPRIR